MSIGVPFLRHGRHRDAPRTLGTLSFPASHAGEALGSVPRLRDPLALEWGGTGGTGGRRTPVVSPAPLRVPSPRVPSFQTINMIAGVEDESVLGEDQGAPTLVFVSVRLSVYAVIGR